jgi:hypothetical protein
MTDLSPAAQAIKDAVLALYSDEKVHKFGWQLDAPTVAAALRAAADQARDNPWPGRIESVGVMWMHDGLLAIAAELEAFSNE